MSSASTLARRARFLHVWSCALVLLAAVGGTAGTAQAQSDEPLKVVATFSILEDLVRNVGADAVELSVIVPAGGDAHTFDPAPDQVATIADADLIVEIGAGFEPWLDDALEASGSSAQRVVVSDGIDLIAPGDAEHEGDEHAEDSPETEENHADHEGDEHADHEGEDHDSASPAADDHAEHEGEEHEGEEHEHGEFDPHVWHDVTNAIAIVETIRVALGTADTGNAATFDANAAAYTTQLQDLDTFVRAEVDTLPEDRRKLVTSHDTFAYFARAYGFEVVGTALSSVTTESNDPSAQEIAELVEQIEAAGVPAIFAENVSNADLMQSIADEAGVTLAPTLYTDALGEPGSPGASYVDMIRYNTTTIVTALSA